MKAFQDIFKKTMFVEQLLAKPVDLLIISLFIEVDIVSVLGRDEGYTVKYNPLPEGVPEGEARGNS